MAGGDGSQAIVATIAAELDLPYACIPAGTRNHFALDLGVDRDDVVGALDAFVDGRRAPRRPRRGQRPRVRQQRLARPLRGGGPARGLSRREAADDPRHAARGARARGRGARSALDRAGRHEHSSGAAILVSNNRYRLGHAVGSGTRPRIDDGLLGITVASAPTGRGERRRLPQRPWREWSTPEFEVDADGPIAAGIDGEALTLDPPLRFRIRPGVLRVRIARAHPGASPSAAIPEGSWETRPCTGADRYRACATEPARRAARRPQ